MEARLYTPEFRAQWEEFVDNASNGTIFHYQKFFDYHPDDRFENHHLIFLNKERIEAVLPAAIINDDNKRILVSHPGASFGGFVVSRNNGIGNSFKLVDALITYCRKNELSCIRITPPPFIYYDLFENHLDFAFYKNGFHYFRRELTAIIPLLNIRDTLSLFRPTARTAMRKSQKCGIETKISHDWQKFYPILLKNLSMRHNVKPTHTLDELLKLTKLFPERIFLYGAYLKNELIAGVVIFVANHKVLLAFYISQDYEHQSLRPLNFLFYQILRWGYENNFKWLDFGLYTLREEPNFGLARFKESFGAKGIFRDTWEKRMEI